MRATAVTSLLLMRVCARQEYVRVRRGVECASGDASFGMYDSVEQCEAACVATFACRFFIFGTGSKVGHCYQEFTEAPSCAEGWEPDEYDFYSLVRWSHIGSVRLHGGGECQSPDRMLGQFEHVHECATACARTPACRYFIFGTGSKAGGCWFELTQSAGCPEGFEDDAYDFYQLAVTAGNHGNESHRLLPPPPPPSPPSPPLLLSPSPAACGAPRLVGPFVGGALTACIIFAFSHALIPLPKHARHRPPTGAVPVALGADDGSSLL